jgi:hypothetical protein
MGPLTVRHVATAWSPMGSMTTEPPSGEASMSCSGAPKAVAVGGRVEA